MACSRPPAPVRRLGLFRRGGWGGGGWAAGGGGGAAGVNPDSQPDAPARPKEDGDVVGSPDAVAKLL